MQRRSNGCSKGIGAVERIIHDCSGHCSCSNCGGSPDAYSAIERHVPLSQGDSVMRRSRKHARGGSKPHPWKICQRNLPSRDTFGSRCPPDSGGREWLACWTYAKFPLPEGEGGHQNMLGRMRGTLYLVTDKLPRPRTFRRRGPCWDTIPPSIFVTNWRNS